MRELSEAIPKDRTVRAYLSLRNESGSPRASRKDPVDVVYIPTTPQGLLVDDGSGNVVQPIEHGSRFGGTNLSDFLPRSEERRVGKEGVSTCRSGGSPYH